MCSSRSQAIANFLGKYVPQHYSTPPEVHEEMAKVRLRNEVHRVEQAPVEDRDQRVKRRLDHMMQGTFTPCNVTFVPVGGWPVLNLETLVLNTMSRFLDPKIWELFQSQFQKTVQKRPREPPRSVEIFKDPTNLFSCITAGFSAIKTHLNESETRISSVRAGFDFTSHFMRSWNERLRREKPEEAEKISRVDRGDPDLVLNKERVRRNEVLFLKTLKYVIEKLLQLKVRHLRSIVPINVDILGTSKDLDTHREFSKRGLTSSHSHTFKDQILMQTPLSARKGTHRSQGSTWTGGAKSKTAFTAAVRLTMQDTRQEHLQPPEVKEAHVRPLTALDLQYNELVRKPWPVLWQALAAAEQGYNVGNPLPPLPQRHKNDMSSICKSRKDWAVTRKELTRSAGEGLWRVDKEKIDNFHVQMASLSGFTVTSFFNARQRLMDRLVVKNRRNRQKHTIFQCELSLWYKNLVEQVHKLVGDKDQEANDLLESIKLYFKLSPTRPKLALAKMALLVMSLPVMRICQIPFQRAINFLLENVLQAPAGTLAHWLKSRGLPLVLL